MISTANDVYEFVNIVIQRSRERGYEQVARRLDDAMHLGSSALEILGAIKNVVLEEADTIGELVDPKEIEDVVQFVNRTFGTQ